MKSIFRYLLLSAFIWAGVSADALAMRIAVFGDGLTYGYQLGPEGSYAIKLQKKLHDIGYTDVEVLNLSLPNDTSSSGLTRLSSVLVKHPDIVVVELGVNDALRGTSVSVIQANLMDIITKLQETGAEVVLLGVQAPASMGGDYVNQFAYMYNGVAGRQRVAFVQDIMEGVTGNTSYTLSDGFYPNSAGADMIIENSYRAVDGAMRAKWNQVQQQQYQQTIHPGQAAPIAAPTGSAPMAIPAPPR